MKILAKAMLQAHDEMPVIENNAINPHFRSNYATLDTIIKQCRPIFSKHGIAVLEYSSGDLQKLSLIHAESGDELNSSIELRCKDASNPQQLKSAQTYARRMLWLSAAGVCPVDEDDDGNQASQEPQKPVKQGKVGLPQATVEAFGAEGEAVLAYLVSVDCIKEGQGFDDVQKWRDTIIKDPKKILENARQHQINLKGAKKGAKK